MTTSEIWFAIVTTVLVVAVCVMVAVFVADVIRSWKDDK